VHWNAGVMILMLDIIEDYCGLTKENPWVEYLISLPKMWVHSTLCANNLIGKWMLIGQP